MLENKKRHRRDATGQLLAGMEKVARDVAFRHLRSSLPLAKKAFTIIEVCGLLCEYATQTCKVYKLEMDFKKRRSILKSGKEELSLVSRLLGTLYESQRNN